MPAKTQLSAPVPLGVQDAVCPPLPPKGCPGHESRRPAPLLALRRLRDSSAKKSPAPPGLGPEGSETSPRRVTRRAAHAARETVLGTPAVSAPGCPPPHIHPSARAARRETSQRPHAVPARPSCAPPGYLRSARRGGTQPWRPSCFLLHRDRSPRRLPRCSRSFVRPWPRVPGLFRPAPGPGDRRRTPAAPGRTCALLRGPSKVAGFLPLALSAQSGSTCW